MSVCGTRKLIRKINKFPAILIYGEGKIGKQVLDALEKLHLSDKVICFVKSDRDFAPYLVKGLEVSSIYSKDVQKYYNEGLFLLAVGSSLLPELRGTVKEIGIRHYLDARSLVLDSYSTGKVTLKLRQLRNACYKKKEEKLWGKGVRKISAAHVTYYLSENAGDTVLSQCVRRFLKFRTWKLLAVSQKVDGEIVAQINKADVLVIGGGGLFLPDTNQNLQSGWQWAVTAGQLEEIRIPIVVFAVGYNYFKGQMQSELFIDSVNRMSEKAAFFGLRNSGSINNIGRIVPENLREKIVYQPCPTTLISKIYPIVPKKGTRIVMFNVAFDREEKRFGQNRNEILEQIATAALEIQKKDFSIVYIAHCDGDLKFLPFLEKAGVSYKVKNLSQCLPGEVYRTYRRAEVVIGMRGHSQMIPFGIGVKIISLGTHEKMKWFLQDVNMLDCYVDLQGECEKICGQITDIFQKIAIDRPDLMEERIEKEKERLWDISIQNRAEIYRLIEGKGEIRKYEG